VRALRGTWQFQVTADQRPYCLQLPRSALFLNEASGLHSDRVAFRLSEYLGYGCAGNLGQCLAGSHTAPADPEPMWNALAQLGLATQLRCTGDLESNIHWHQQLSRVARVQLSVARVLYQRPAPVVMDDALHAVCSCNNNNNGMCDNIEGSADDLATMLLRACFAQGITVLYLRPPADNWMYLFKQHYMIDARGRLRKRCLPA